LTEAGLDHGFQGVHAPLVASQAWQMSLLRPASVTIHNDGNMLGQLLGGGHVGRACGKA